MSKHNKGYGSSEGSYFLYSLVIILLLFSCSHVKAEEKPVTVHAFMFSQHFDGTADQLNQDNNLLGVEWDGYFIETFENSFEEETFYVGRLERNVYNFTDKFSFGFSWGIIDGYSRINGGKPIPIIMPMLSYKFDSGYGIDVSCIPEADEDKIGKFIVCAIQFNYTFGGD